MTRRELIALISKRKSFLCIGLDPDPSKLPAGVSVLDFNKAVIDATREWCVAYKPNIAFYEFLGSRGWDILEKTIEYIGNEHFTIADAKRGDIGNTSSFYAKTYFERYSFDSVTVAPYMGRDSIEPFLQFEGKWAVILALTSNNGSADFQLFSSTDSTLYEKVLSETKKYGNDENTMYVVGATRAVMLKKIREIIPSHFILVPGVGAQGGDLAEVAKYGMTADCGLLVNVSRSVLFASSKSDFAVAAGNEAKKIQMQMNNLLSSTTF